MRKWAYEIHSTFLVPSSPLSFFPDTDNMCETIARDVDDKLAHTKNFQPTDRGGAQDFEMAGWLKNVFQKARSKARDMVNCQMEEFQEKRIAGMGTMFGPTAPELAAAKRNKAAEQTILDNHLLPLLQKMLDEAESSPESDVKMALASALSTVVHKIFLPRGTTAPNAERIHHYVTREKSFKSRLISKGKGKLVVRGHHLSLRQYYETTHCNHCGNLIWGVAPQGYSCSDCGLNVHRGCAKSLDETCPGPVNGPSVDKFTKFMDKIREKGHGMQSEYFSMSFSIDFKPLLIVCTCYTNCNSISVDATKKQEEDTTHWDDALPSGEFKSFFYFLLCVR